MQCLVQFIYSCTPAPNSHIGITLAQEVMQNITQSSLSGKFISSIKYCTINDILNLRSKDTKCYIYEEDNVIDYISKVTILDIIDKITANYNNIHILLSKTKMRDYNITMRQISKATNGLYEYGYNYMPYIYIITASESDAISHISNIENTTVKGYIDVNKDNMNRYYCDNKYITDLIRLNIHYECTNVNIVYKYYGIDKAKELIYNTLVSNHVRPFCAEFISTYMTMKGRPLPFDKELIGDKFGPLFNMYFSKSKSELCKWIINNNIDNCNNQYTKMILGCNNRF